jgi:hypothetical protein
VLEDAPPFPSVEGETGRARIDAMVSKIEATLERVAPGVEKNVGEPVPRLPRRLHRARVVAIREHAPNAAKRAVEASSHPDLEAPHRTTERSPVGRFDDQVQMVALNGEMNEAHI